MPQTDAAARTARTEFDRLLETDAPALAGRLPAGFAETAELYLALLLEANARLNLTRVVEPEEVARLHLLDAVSALPIIDRLGPRTALDLGTGGGIPGMLLAIARREIAWVLADSVGRKVDAVAGFASSLGLINVETLADRAELIGRGPRRETLDLVTARACAALPVLAEYALPLLRVGGSLLAWKGPRSDDELRAGASAAIELGGGTPIVEPAGIGALGNHRFVLIAKERPTPERYPRRPGVPARRPLG